MDALRFQHAEKELRIEWQRNFQESKVAGPAGFYGYSPPTIHLGLTLRKIVLEVPPSGGAL